MIIQTAYMAFKYTEKSIPVSGTCMEWLTEIDAKPWTTIYSSSYPKPNVILILSGAYRQNYCFYVEKMIRDLLSLAHIEEKYTIVFYEDLRNTNLDMAGPISKFLAKYNEKVEIEELIYLGISAGGVLASHIATNLYSLAIPSKIITYDTPLDLIHTLKMHSSNVFRLDIFFYYLFYLEYLNHYDEYIRENHTLDWRPSSHTMFKSVMHLHNMTLYDVAAACRFQYRLPSETGIYHIYSDKDPLLMPLDQTAIKPVDYPNIHYINKYTHGHSSDMAFDNTYVIYINGAIMD